MGFGTSARQAPWRLIGDVGPETFRELEPSPVEYSTLLKDIEDDDLCRRMPIHTDLAGTFVAIDQHSYWQSDITVPAGLAASITILRKSENDAAWRRQLVLTRQLDTNVLIDIVLSHKEPGRYWMVIMDALAEKGGTSPECAQVEVYALAANMWWRLRAAARHYRLAAPCGRGGKAGCGKPQHLL